MKEFLHQLGYRTVDDAIEFLMAGLATLPVLLMLTGHVVLGAFVLCALIVALALVGRFAPPDKPGKPKDRLHR